MSKPYSVKDSVMKSITSGEVVIRSRRHFVIRKITMVTSLILAIAAAALFINLIVRDVQVARGLGLDSFGLRGVREYISSFPWLFTLLCVAAVVAMITLIKRFDFSYRYRFNTTFGAMAIVILAIGGMIGLSGVNEPISQLAPVETFSTYSRFAEERQVMGEISEIGEDFITIETQEGQQVDVEIDEATDFPASYEPQVGDAATAFGSFDGEKDDGNDEDRKKKFKAFGVKSDKDRDDSRDDSRDKNDRKN